MSAKERARKMVGMMSLTDMLTFLLEDRCKREEESERRTAQMEKQIEMLTKLVEEPWGGATRQVLNPTKSKDRVRLTEGDDINYT